MNRVEYRPAVESEYEALRAFLSSLGWEKRVRDADRFRRMMVHADRTMVALEGDRIVGFGRALCDGASNGYISMVAVAPDRRGQGIGRGLVTRLMAGDPDREVTWVLRAGRGSAGFWEKMGFTWSTIAMERARPE